MQDITNQNLDYDRPIMLADDVHWVGIHDSETRWLSSPYLIIDDGEAVLIDGGSRSDFAAVMMKIMQAGVVPGAISALIYQNYNPRLWGSLHHLEVLIDRKDLRIVSDRANLMFIQHHSQSTNLISLDDLGFQWRFASGRLLSFIKTPFAHSAGSFVTYDHKSSILFTGDLFSSYAKDWRLLLRLPALCRNCERSEFCSERGKSCPVEDILTFHREIMSSERAVKYALEQISIVPFKIIAPQHGSVIYDSEDIVFVSDLLSNLRGIGIDGIIGNRAFRDLGDTSMIKERLLGCEGCKI